MSWDIRSLSEVVDLLISVPQQLENPIECFFENKGICRKLEAPPIVSGSGQYPALFYGKKPSRRLWVTPWDEPKERFCIPIAAGGELASCCEVERVTDENIHIFCRGTADYEHISLVRKVARKVFGIDVALAESNQYDYDYMAVPVLEKEAQKLIEDEGRVILLDPLSTRIHLVLGPAGYAIYRGMVDRPVEFLRTKFRWVLPPSKLRRNYIKKALHYMAHNDMFAKFAAPLYHKRIAALIPGYGDRSDIKSDEELKSVFVRYLNQIG